jgi:DNA end-binding protein Ku
VGCIPCARAMPGLAAIHLGDQRQQFALAATDGRVRGVDGRYQMLFGMEIVPAHAATNRSGGGTSHHHIERTFACQLPFSRRRALSYALAMARAVWTGSLSFGLVTIPVRLYPSTEPKDVRFHLMDAQGRRVRYRRFVSEEEPSEPTWETPEAPETERPASEDPREGESGQPARPAPSDHDAGSDEQEIAFDDLMRGYETEDGRVIMLSRDEVESVRPERSRTIDIEDFVALSDIDPVYFEKSYHLAPQTGGEKPYALLLRAMEHAGRVGIGRFVLRTKPHLVAIRPTEGVLGLETLFFGDEVRDGREVVYGLDGIDLSSRELEMAEMLIETMKTEWNPAAYSDTYREELLRRISEKAPIEVRQEAANRGSGGQVEELMQALKASVEAAKSKKGTSKKRPA